MTECKTEPLLPEVAIPEPCTSSSSSVAASPSPEATHHEVSAIKKIFTDPKNLLTRTRADGLLETFDVTTGMVIAVSSSDRTANTFYSASSAIPRDFVEINTPQGEKILLDKSLDPSVLSTSFSANLTPVLKDKIFEYIASGDSLYTLAKKRKGMPPYSLLLRWYHRYQEFRDMIDTARRFRAEYLYDRILENATILEHGGMNKADVDAMTNATNFLKWGCEISDPVGYGNKKDANQGGVTIIVNTGVDRTPEEVIEVKPSFKEDYGEEA